VCGPYRSSQTSSLNLHISLELRSSSKDVTHIIVISTWAGTRHRAWVQGTFAVGARSDWSGATRGRRGSDRKAVTG